MRSFRCLNPKCTYLFPSNSDLRKHLNDESTCGSYGYKCLHCNDVFVQSNHLTMHLKNGKCNDSEIMIDSLSTINHTTIAKSSLPQETSNITFDEDAIPTLNSNMFPFLDAIVDQQSRIHMHKNPGNKEVAVNQSELVANRLLESLLSMHTLMIEYDDEEEHDQDEAISFDNEDQVPTEIVPEVQVRTNYTGAALVLAFTKMHWDFSSNRDPLEQCLRFDIPDNGVLDLQNLRDKLPVWDHIVFGEMQRTLLQLHSTIMNGRKGMSLYNDIVDWATSNANALADINLLGGTPNIFSMLQKQFYGDSQDHFLPRTKTINFSTGRRASVTTFSFIGAIVDLLLSGNKVHTHDFSTGTVDENELSDVQSGTWWRNTYRHVCGDENHKRLISVIFFIDSVVIGDFEKLSQIPVMFTLSCFDREERKKREAWRVVGYVDYDNNVAWDNELTSREKTVELHEALKVVLAELSVIQKNGFKWNLKNEAGCNETYIMHVEVQHIIADVEGADPLCGRKKGHLKHMKGRSRDCNVTWNDVDDPNHECVFFQQDEMLNQNEATLETRNFHKLENPFFKFLSFGSDVSGMYGCTPTECLHHFDQGLCVRVTELVHGMLSEKARQLLNSACSYICASNILQSERDIPNLGPFRNGFESVSKLKGEERFARVFILYLVLSSSDFIRYIIKVRPKKGTRFTIEYWQSVYSLLEDTLILRSFLKQAKIKKSLLVPSSRGQHSTLESFIRNYMTNLRAYLPRTEGNGWKLVKFHQLLHIVPNILKHGSPLNTDSSIPEGLGKDFAKELSRRTRRRTLTLGKETASRYFELLLIDKAKRLLNTSTPTPANTVLDTASQTFDFGSRFLLRSTEPYLVWIKGNKRANSTSLLSFPQQILQAVVARLYYSDNGGTISQTQEVPGFTEFRKESSIFRAHPCFNGYKPWYDYCYVDWGEDGIKPALINMFIDLRNVPIIQQANPFLQNEIYAVIQSVSDLAFTYDATGRKYHMKSRLGSRFGLERQRRFIAVESIHSPAYVRPNDIGKIEGQLHYFDNTILVIKPKAEWPLIIE